jgi:hypothetical protein
MRGKAGLEEGSHVGLKEKRSKRFVLFQFLSRHVFCIE